MLCVIRNADPKEGQPLIVSENIKKVNNINNMEESVNIQELNERISRESAFVDALTMELRKNIVGQKHMIESLMIGLLSNGHILLEGVPGLAKTLTITSLANAIDAKFSRIQFTPDLLPADLLGTMIYSQKSETFNVKKGPIFSHFIFTTPLFSFRN